MASQLEFVRAKEKTYGVLLSRLREDIVEGKYKPNELLPSEVEMARQFKISRGSVRQALDVIVQEGLVRKVVGKGNLVRSFEHKGPGSKGTLTIGVIIEGWPELSHNPFLVNVLKSLERSSGEKGHGCRLFFEFTDFLTSGETKAYRMLESAEVDGMVLMPFSRRGLDLAEMLGKNDKPVFCFLRQVDNPHISQVYIDHYDGAARAIEYLIHLGHRRIATISIPSFPGNPSWYRQQGFRGVLRLAGYPVDETLMIETEYTDETLDTREGMIIEHTLRLMSLANPPTAIFVTDGVLTPSVLCGLEQAGKKVPDDVSVVSYDDTPANQAHQPPITVIRQPVETAGDALVNEIIHRFRSTGQKPRKMAVSPELVVRRSCTPLKG